VHIWDAHGQQYLDFSGSAAVNFIGHGVAEIPAAMAEQARHLSFAHTSQFTTPVSESYAQELLDFAGEGFQGGAVYFTSGGSEAIESSLKLARQYQVEIGEGKRYQVLSRRQSYHGSTLGALAVSGNRSRRELYLPMVRQFAHIGIPYCYRCAFDCSDSCRRCGEGYAAELEVAIAAAKGEVAGFIFEPVSGATLGAATPPPGYLERISEICRAQGVLLIADEVMTGMGRTGRNFAVEHWGIAPDMLVVAKGLSSTARGGARQPQDCGRYCRRVGLVSPWLHLQRSPRLRRRRARRAPPSQGKPPAGASRLEHSRQRRGAP
jgi:adenosylmethionine-8-amino-7-oxononanoate aminotransferase